MVPATLHRHVSWQALAASAALTIPWLNPFAPGPSPAVEPWLVSLACVIALRWGFPGAGIFPPPGLRRPDRSTSASTMTAITPMTR